MAHHDYPSNPRQVSPTKTAHARRVHKRRVRNDVLRHELELREHPPTREPEHVPRRLRKARTPLWKHVRRAAGVLMLLGAVELGAAALTAKPFEVKSFDIAGCALTDVDQVHALAEPLVGQNWIRAGRHKVERQIAALPTVKAAHVSRVLDWPPRLHIAIEERAAFAKVGAGNDWWVVDENGVAFRRATEADKDLYAVTGPKLRARLGSTLSEKEWRPVVEIAAALRSKGDQDWSLRRVYFDKDGSAALRLAGGFNDETLVRLGSDHWSEKLVRARQALAYFERTGRRAAVLNLVSYEMPQWTPRSSQTTSNSHPHTASTPATEESRERSVDTPSET
jgi:cell division septal protein FtsQ